MPFDAFPPSILLSDTAALGAELMAAIQDLWGKERRDDARALMRLAVASTNADFLHRAGLQAYGFGCHAEAVALIAAATALSPHDSNYYNSLGVTRRAAGQADSALVAYRRAVLLNPDYVEAHYNYGNALRSSGQPEKAIVEYQAAVRVRPDFAEAHYNLGISYFESRKEDDGIREFLISYTYKKDYFDPIVRLADYHNTVTRNLDLAVTMYKAALKVQPDHPDVWNSLGSAYARLGKVDESVACYRVALQKKPNHEKASNNVAFAINYGLVRSNKAIFEQHQYFETNVASQVANLIKPHTNNRDPNRKLRVGYVSADLRQHSVVYFMAPALPPHATPDTEVYLYSNVKGPDGMTELLKQLPLQWRDISRMNDDDAAEQIRKDEIDILVDLGGHTVENRLMVFARKPAPVQVSWIGYANTTGMAAMDYRLTDDLADPVGVTDQWHSERLMRLRPCFLRYRPASGTPDVAPPPVEKNGYVTFGSFNNPMKLRQEVADLWARIVNRVPNSRLLLKGIGMQDPMLRAHVQNMFANAELAAERLILRTQTSSQVAHLQVYNDIDIALDPFPYNGTTTTCEALLMGVPVVTLAGDRHAGRVGLSLLNAVGLPEMVAISPDDYVERAAALAFDRGRLASLRAGLRDQLQASPLFDYDGGAKELARLYRMMWQEWCRAPR